jgi:hypothetical protein
VKARADDRHARRNLRTRDAGEHVVEAAAETFCEVARRDNSASPGVPMIWVY